MKAIVTEIDIYTKINSYGENTNYTVTTAIDENGNSYEFYGADYEIGESVEVAAKKKSFFSRLFSKKN